MAEGTNIDCSNPAVYLAVLMYAVMAQAKNMHYEVYGKAFRSNHEFADAIGDADDDDGFMDADDYKDDIQETLLLGNLLPAIPEELLMAKAAELVVSDEFDEDVAIQGLLSLLTEVVNLCNEDTWTNSEGDLTGKIGHKAQQSFGLLSRVLIEGGRQDIISIAIGGGEQEPQELQPNIE